MLRIHRSNMSTSAGYELKGGRWGHELIVRLWITLFHHVVLYLHILNQNMYLKKTQEFEILNVLFFSLHTPTHVLKLLTNSHCILDVIRILFQNC